MKIAIVFLVLILSGCGTMFNSGQQSIVAIPSYGKEVKVKINTSSGSYLGKIPATIITTPSTFKTVSIEVVDDCFNASETIVEKGVTPSYWANIFNVYGFIIDPLTGAMWRYDNIVNVPVTEKACGKT